MKDTGRDKSVSNAESTIEPTKRFHLLNQNQLFPKLEEIRARSGAQSIQEAVENSIHLLSVMGYFVENLNAQVRIHFPDGTSAPVVLAPKKEIRRKPTLTLVKGGLG